MFSINIVGKRSVGDSKKMQRITQKGKTEKDEHTRKRRRQRR
jgi:hypothetical protein